MRRTLLAITAVLLATIGTTLLYVYVSTADNRAMAQVKRVKVLVAAGDMPAGTPATRLRAELREVAVFDMMPRALRDPAALRGKVLTVQVFDRQQLTDRMFGPAATSGLPKGHRAVSAQFGEAERVGNLVKAGSTVDVYRLTGNAEVVLTNATVLSVNAKTGIVTFDLNPTEAKRLLDALAAGRLVLDVHGTT